MVILYGKFTKHTLQIAIFRENDPIIVKIAIFCEIDWISMKMTH